MAAHDIHIRFPRILYESINVLVVKEGYYRSAPEFILECTRTKLDEIRKYRIDQRKINIYWRQQKEDSKRINPKVNADIGTEGASACPNITYKYQT